MSLSKFTVDKVTKDVTKWVFRCNVVLFYLINALFNVIVCVYYLIFKILNINCRKIYSIVVVIVARKNYNRKVNINTEPAIAAMHGPHSLVQIGD